MRVFAWALFDFASTLFSMNVITLYFALWVTIDMQRQDIFYSMALSGSMLLAAIMAPIFGAIADYWQRKMPFLIIFTLIAGFFTALIGITNYFWLGLVAFMLANFSYQSADIIYNGLLPQVSIPKTQGRTSGYGKGLAYAGAIAGLAMVGPIALHYGRQATFIPTAILFLVFALPCLILVKDKPQSHRNTQFGRLYKSLLAIKCYPVLWRSLIAIFIALNAVDTVFIFMSVYTKKVIGFTDQYILWLYGISSVFAILGAVLAGFLTDVIGAKRTLIGSLLLWCTAIFLAIIATNDTIFWLIGPLIGLSIGAIWSSARVLIAELAPAKMEGEVFGFYGLIIKLSMVIGPMLWGLCIWSFSNFGLMSYRFALIMLILFLLIGLTLLVLWAKK